MSRFLKSMIALLAIAAFAAPAFATDLSITGQMRVEGYYIDADVDGVDNDAEAYFDQRFRVNVNAKVSDEVKAVLRVDFGENQWGNNGLNSIRSTVYNFYQLHIDKAYLQLDKEMFSVSAGQQYFGLGNTIAVDHVGPGFILALKTPVSFKLLFTKVDENGSFTDEDATEDTNFYAADAGFKGDGFAANAFYAVMENGATDFKKTVIGLTGTFNADAFKINAELNLFGGDNGLGTDYMGTQAYVDASFAASEVMTVGGFFLYAAGSGSDDEIQVTHITDFGSFMPETYGYLATMQYVYGETFNPSGLNAGIISPAVYLDFKASDDLGFKFMAQYLMEEEDALAGFDAFNLNVSTKYKVATNTYLIAQVNYIDGEVESNIEGLEDSADFDSMGLWTQLVVNF
jgi:hypothetical protein